MAVDCCSFLIRTHKNDSRMGSVFGGFLSQILSEHF